MQFRLHYVQLHLDNKIYPSDISSSYSRRFYICGYNYKTIFVSVPPVIKVTNQLVAAPVESDVVLQCQVEASPQALNTWHQNTGNEHLSQLNISNI